ncbi:MAG: hypothetical protein ACFFDP_04420, partial [Promethearchaeota archaeon]
NSKRQSQQTRKKRDSKRAILTIPSSLSFKEESSLFGKAPRYDCALIAYGPVQSLIQIENSDFIARNSTPKLIISGTGDVLLAAMRVKFQSI